MNYDDSACSILNSLTTWKCGLFVAHWLLEFVKACTELKTKALVLASISVRHRAHVVQVFVYCRSDVLFIIIIVRRCLRNLPLLPV